MSTKNNILKKYCDEFLEKYNLLERNREKWINNIKDIESEVVNEYSGGINKSKKIVYEFHRLKKRVISHGSLDELRSVNNKGKPKYLSVDAYTLAKEKLMKELDEYVNQIIIPHLNKYQESLEKIEIDIVNYKEDLLHLKELIQLERYLLI